MVSWVISAQALADVAIEFAVHKKGGETKGHSLEVLLPNVPEGKIPGSIVKISDNFNGNPLLIPTPLMRWMGASGFGFILK